MGSNPINLIVRFLLEITTLVAVGMWGWNKGENGMEYLYVIGIPFVLATIWGTFAVPNDPSRSGKAPVPTRGVVRLFIELLFFGLGTWGLHAMEYIILSKIMGIIVFLHYLISYDRVKWLLSK